MTSELYPEPIHEPSICAKVVRGVLAATALSLSQAAPAEAHATPNKPTPADIKTLQVDSNENLVPLGMPELKVDGKLGSQTIRAACAQEWLIGGSATRSKANFTKSKINHMNTADTITNPTLPEIGNQRLANGFIVNETCQVMARTRNNIVVQVIPVSTGKKNIEGQKPTETPNDAFKISHARHDWHDSTESPSEDGNGNMYNPLYFNGAIAMHGHRSMNNKVTTPNSNGCVRVSVSHALKIYESIAPLAPGEIRKKDQLVKNIPKANKLPVVVTGEFK